MVAGAGAAHHQAGAGGGIGRHRLAQPDRQADGNRGATLVATIHPSYLLRIRDDDDKAAEYGRFVNDLRLCAELLEKVA